MKEPGPFGIDPETPVSTRQDQAAGEFMALSLTLF